ncbi:catalase [Rhodoferax sp.]|uniref:catalase n=1 Tax=Rhodoferax sp. TaxID=50421 RepID=UPI00374DF25D
MTPRTPAKEKTKIKAPAAKPLAQQKADFTAEGAPPPGKVALTEPVTRNTQAAPTDPAAQTLTTNQGLPFPDNHNSLKAGVRGPTLLEDFILREKITHFDHERIPERAVHARGAGAHGTFQVYEDLSDLTCAEFLCQPALQTPVFVRFSTVAGSRGSADTARDARGFAVKFYTAQGNYDLVGNNIPVFFIQDAIKFPDLIHAVKPEPHNEIPQAASAHDTFWDFVTLMPESTHMLMWVMSDRAIPRSLRMMEGFGVHTFRLVNAQGVASFVKFHWKPLLDTHGLAWDEAQKLAGKDADFHRRDLWDAIDSGNFPEWELGLQVVPEADEHRFNFDLLDPTKLIPEELVPVRRVGRLVLNRNPDNFFAETEQVAFHPGHLVPGIDFSNDPLLQGRLFSYTDTQLSRLGSANFHELPINQSKCPMHNFQRDGMHRQTVNTGRVAYEPNTLGSGREFRVDGQQAGASGFSSLPEALEPPKIRRRSPSFDDHFSQARMFWISQSVPEQDHIVAAFQFELSKLDTPAIRQRMVDNLAHVDGQLAARVAAPLGIGAPDAQAATKWSGFRAAPHPLDVQPSPALSMLQPGSGSIATRTVAILVANGVDAAAVHTLQHTLTQAGAQCKVLANTLGQVAAADGGHLPVDGTLQTNPSVVFDAVFLPCMGAHAAAMSADGDAVHFVLEAYKHCKPIAACGSGAGLLASLGVAMSTEPGVTQPLPGVVLAAAGELPEQFAQSFIDAIAAHRHWERNGLATVPA